MSDRRVEVNSTVSGSEERSTQHSAESDAAAEEYAAGVICYRTTNPHAHHNTVKAAFLAGVEFASTRVTSPEKDRP